MSDHKLKAVTLKDIGDKIGVSAMTVSRALSGKSQLVSDDTARRCREAAAEMGYVPNLMARGLRGEQLDTLVMFAEHLSSHHYLAELVDMVSRSIERRKFGVICCQSIVSLRQALRNFKLGGAVIIAPPEEFYRDLAAGGLAIHSHEPVVIIHSAVTQCVLNEVSPDIAMFSYQATSHLAELGHRHIGYLGGPNAEDEPSWFELRRGGIERALKEYNLPPSALRFQACSDATRGPSAVQQLLKRWPETSAVMCINDEIAISAVVGAGEMGLRVPHDLSVVGCNDIKLAGFFRPGLTTLAIDINTMVESALDLLFEEIRSGKARTNARPVKIMTQAELIVRGSTAPPAKRVPS
jgi:LacI family transcriptional regulator